MMHKVMVTEYTLKATTVHALLLTVKESAERQKINKGKLLITAPMKKAEMSG